MKKMLIVAAVLLLLGSSYVYIKSSATIEAKKSTEESFKKSSDMTHDCDLQAAHPEDALRYAQGKTDEEIIPVLALRACSEAVRQFPNEPRFHFQMGRALAAMKKVEEAAKEFEAAASMGYAPAKFYRADAIMDSYLESGNEDDYQKAVQMLEQTKESFPPAAKRYREVVYSPEGFQSPRIIDGLYYEDYERLNRARILVALWGQGFQEFLATEWNPEDNDCPAYMLDPSINYDLDAAVAGDPSTTVERLKYDTILFGVEWAGTLIYDPTWKGDSTKWRDYYKALGKRDAQFMVREFGGCRSPVAKKIYYGLVQFAKAKKPFTDYYQDLRNGSGKELFLRQNSQAANEEQGQATESR